MGGSKGQEIVYTWARLNTPTHKELSDTIDAALRAAKVEALREMKTALTSQSGTSAWDVVSYIEARIIELERENLFTRHNEKGIDARAAQIENEAIK